MSGNLIISRGLYFSTVTLDTRVSIAADICRCLHLSVTSFAVVASLYKCVYPLLYYFLYACVSPSICFDLCLVQCQPRLYYTHHFSNLLLPFYLFLVNILLHVSFLL